MCDVTCEVPNPSHCPFILNSRIKTDWVNEDDVDEN